MKFDLMEAITQELSKKVEIVKKINKYCDKTGMGATLSSDEQIRFMIIKETEQKIAEFLQPHYQEIFSNVKKKIRFSDYEKIKGKKPVEVMATFVIYKFVEILLDSWLEPDQYEKDLVELISHNINTKDSLKYDKVDHIADLLTGISGSNYFFDLFMGSSELYAYVSDILHTESIKIEDLEKHSLSKKEIEEVVMCICRFVDTTVQNGTHKKDSNYYLTIDINYVKEDWQQILILFFIGCLIKVFLKVISQKDRATKKIIKESKMTVAVEEDIKTKRLTEQKQRALNDLQIQYDRLKKKSDNQQQLLQEYEECFKLLLEEQVTEEKILEENPGASPFVPSGKGIVLYGGSPNYQKKFATLYPHVEVVPVKSAKTDRQKLINARIILINWRYLSHPQFWTIIQVIREHKKEYYYVW